MTTQPTSETAAGRAGSGPVTEARADTVDCAVRLAAEASQTLAQAGDAALAAALRLAADRLDAAKAELIPAALAESHLPESRLAGELARTTFQLRIFADLLGDGSSHGVVVDHADPSWGMGPRPDLRRCLVPLGPVAVFAASNFPFAFSAAGGDTAAALAAGCSVIVKAHPGHPHLSELTGEIVTAALSAAGLPDGAFAVIHGEQAGIALVQHPLLAAVAFTGSLHGGRALFDLACARPEPIPFYGELGSLNPVFVTPAAAAARREEIIAGFVGSFTLGAGQLCTKPGLLLVPADAGFAGPLAGAVREVAAAPLLNERIAVGYAQTSTDLAGRDGVQTLVAGAPAPAGPEPSLLMMPAAELASRSGELMVECFGPASVLVPYSGLDELRAVAAALPGQLTATVQGEDNDPDAAQLIGLLARRAGRVIWNGWPTGVSVTWAQHHGGPYPATTNSLHTSVGTASISRFQRPVAFQGMPERLLPEVLREQNLGRVPARVDGQLRVTEG
jgi:NADP-dependent aldehyde dehydrogenase